MTLYYRDLNYKYVKADAEILEELVKPMSVKDKLFLLYKHESDTEERKRRKVEDDVPGGSASMEDKSDDWGKWMVFLDNSREIMGGGMTELDYAWQFMKSLVDDYENTGIIAVGSTTAHSGGRPKKQNGSEGAIVCYVDNYKDKEHVKKVADTIREAFHFTQDMFFKTKKATDAGRYVSKGYRGVSIYKHTSENKMFERNDHQKWIECCI